eukprot:gene9243-19184_t
MPYLVSTSDQDKAMCDLVAATNVASLLPHWKCAKGRPLGQICNRDRPIWNEISCDKSGYVTKIAIRYKSLSGTIPSSLGNLVHLTYLSFFRNHLTGTIPSTFGKLTNLQYLSLQNNHLSGTIPTALGSLPHLSELWLVSNSLAGPIPSQIGLATNIKFLELSSNFLTGTVPTSLGNMKRLKVLHIDNNDLSGTVPSSLCNLRLSALYLFWVGNGDKGNTGLLCYHSCLTGVFDKKYGHLPMCSYAQEL